MSNPNIHTFDPLPVVLLGGDSGRLPGDRHLVQAEGTPMANLMLALARSGGASMEKFGDSTGTVSL
jgi:molybdopterin-guanine dinucleotide biosynthesis protein A